MINLPLIILFLLFCLAKVHHFVFREKEIEEKMGKMEVKDEPEKPGVYRPPGARGERSDDRYLQLLLRDEIFPSCCIL